MRHAIVRADGGEEIGGGHIMRCLVIASELSAQNWWCTVVGSPETKLVSPLLGTIVEFVALPDSENESAHLVELFPLGCDLLIVDHYGRDYHFENLCRGWAKQILVVDDAPSRRHDADWLVDPTMGRQAIEYEPYISRECHCLTGSNYTLLREEFLLNKSRSAQITENATRVLVTLGGSDPQNFTEKVVGALSGLELAVKVVIGPANPNKKCLIQGGCKKNSSNIEFVVNPSNMAELMEWSDVAVTAGGGTCWELAFLGVPSLILVIAENQKEIASQLDHQGISINLGDANSVSADKITATLLTLLDDTYKRMKMSSRGKQLIDGAGARRIVQALEGNI